MFGLPISCPVCGGVPELVQSRACTTEAVAVLDCRGCERQWTVSMQIRLLGRPAAVRQRHHRAQKAVAA